MKSFAPIGWEHSLAIPKKFKAGIPLDTLIVSGEYWMKNPSSFFRSLTEEE